MKKNSLKLFVLNGIKIFASIIFIVITFISISFKEEKHSVKANTYMASNQLSYSNVAGVLNSFYNKLKSANSCIFNTNKFLCTGTNITCASSIKYNKIGLINKSEVDIIGSNSYLFGSRNYWTMSESGDYVYNVNSTQVELILETSFSGIRAAIYISNNVSITGMGHPTDPYIIKINPE